MTGSGGTRQDELATEYTRIRPRLLGAAYALLGAWAEAEDVVADTWLRLTAADQRDPVADVEAWAVVAVSRRALDVLRSARVQREAYVGPWLPEPLVERLPGPAGRMAWRCRRIWPTRPTGSRSTRASATPCWWCWRR